MKSIPFAPWDIRFSKSNAYPPARKAALVTFVLYLISLLACAMCIVRFIANCFVIGIIVLDLYSIRILSDYSKLELNISTSFSIRIVIPK